MGRAGRNLETELVEEAVRQLRKSGMERFSARAVAEACHVSCAAPYKHFKGRQELFRAMSEHLDETLLKTMEEIEEKWAGNYKQAHLEMNVAYICYLCQNPFLINGSFWKLIDEEQAGIRKWKSFQKMTHQFFMYCETHRISREIYKSYYFNFQALAYGTAFVITSHLVLEGSDPRAEVLDLQERIYKNLEQTISAE